jgi:uncharacterized protein involved in exopolysaccharide biosynthesis
MDSQPKQSPGSAPAEYGASGYGYGYSATGYGESSAQRSLNDYLLILRERVWYVVVVFLVVLSSALVYTFSQTKIYESTASVQILRQDPIVMDGQPVLDTAVRTVEDLNTIVKIMESGTIMERVNQRITGDDLRQFMAPYEKGRWGDPLTPREVLFENRRVVPLRLSLVVGVTYSHPDPMIAARIANMFVDELLQWNSRVRIDDTSGVAQDLQVRVEQQRKLVDDLANELAATWSLSTRKPTSLPIPSSSSASLFRKSKPSVTKPKRDGNRLKAEWIQRRSSPNCRSSRSYRS